MSPKPDSPDVARGATPSSGLLPAAIVRSLRCPLCQQQIVQESHRLYCPNGHSFDRGRQGHVTLGLGRRTSQNADSPAMVAARERLLGSGLYGPIRERASELVSDHAPREEAALVADLAGGTGYYLAGILDRLPGSLGICVDLSTAALKRAARCHANAAAVGADLRDPLPIAAGSVSVVASFFGPRPVPEIRRVLRADGILAVVTPTERHLAELVDELGMVKVDQQKEQRLASSLSSLTRLTHERLEYEAVVVRDQARAIVSMGPSAHHVTPQELEARLDGLAPETRITVSVNLGIYSP